jgi:4-hydroxyphenylpyruvate dioxygenase
MTRLSVATTNVPGDLAQKFEQIAAAGFTGIELCEPDLTGFAGSADEVGKLASVLGLTIEVLQPFHDFEGLSGNARKAAFARLDQKLDLMRSLGAQTLLIGTTSHPEAASDIAQVTEDFRELAARVDQAGCRAALIALPWARHITTELEALKIVQSVDSRSFGLALNSFFSLAGGEQSARLRDIPGDRIFHVQLSDAPALDFDITRLKSHFGLLPGQGGLNLASFVRMVARLGYQGPWSIARVGATAEGSREAHARDAFRSLVSLLDEVSAREPALERPLEDLPSRVTPTGVEFIEFAADGADRDRLTRLLETMCFRKERQHRSKAVELWRQGAINLVVNSETKGFAAEARAEHGACVCDMGLRVQDAEQTVARATALGAPSFSQPVGAGELDIPAIKGVGGSVVHFIDEKSDLHRVWDIEFDPVPKERAAQPAGLRRIDHVAQTMRYQEMQSWLTYYLTTFEMDKAPVVDVADPSGIILSQALASPEGEVRLNLNGAGERRTFAGAFLAQGFGAGVQHLAFLSDDIFETSDLLAAAGFERLLMPANYYDDLRVRFDLPDDLITKLMAGDILYDCDGRGEYFQIYSIPIWGGVFFEIVARKGGYQGYGARNAPIRLAAQMRHLKEFETA